jgi:phosphopantothenoylcysteine decarboxylase/phosphopantothenate--cysteine ligase
MCENPDILKTLGHAEKNRPTLVIGFAAETENIVKNAHAKLTRKNCDWVLANDVSSETDTFGGAHNTVHLVSAAGVEDWPRMTKEEVGEKLANRIADTFETRISDTAEKRVSDATDEKS